MSQTSSPARFRLATLSLGVVALVAAGCSGSPTAPPSPSPMAAASSAAQGAGGGAPQSSAGKVDVCHRSGRGFNLINVSANALQAHLGHGDGQPGGSVPGGSRQVFGASCQVIQLTQYTLTLASGAEGGVGSLDPAITWVMASGGNGTAVILKRHNAYAALPGAQWVNWAILTNAGINTGYGAAHGTSTVSDDVTYSTAFTLPADATDVSLTGSFYADNRGDGFLNGAPIGGHTAAVGGGGFSTAASVSASSGFAAGSNTLSFKVQDFGGVAGLTYSVTVTYWAQ